MRSILRPWRASNWKAKLLNKHLSRRNFAYPKEGVFQQHLQPQQQPQYGVPTTTIPQQAHFQYGAPLPPPPPPPSARRWRPRWTTVTIAVLSATLGFYQVRSILANLVITLPSESEQAQDLATAYRIYEELDLVQSLRSSWNMVDGKQEPEWKEYTAYQAMTEPKERAGRLTTGPLGNPHGVAAQKIFYSKNAMVHFVCFGNGTTGWPRVVHGGALATILDESLGRFAARHVKERTAVTAYLETKYVAMCEPGQWYVIILGLDDARENDQTERKKYVGGFLACCGDDGPRYTSGRFENVHPHVVANALFVVPKDVSHLSPIPGEF